jgi:hypothetical protein
MPKDDSIIIDELRMKEIRDMWQAQYGTGRWKSVIVATGKEAFDGMNGIWYEYDFKASENLVVSLEDRSGWDIP